MASETETTTGQCPTHGTIDATRQIPRMTFPPIITSISRAIAKRRRPYLCPICGEPVKTH